MESRCSLIRGNVTDKTWASRYTSSPAIQQLLLPDFIVSLVHKSQLSRRAGPRRPAPTIIKIELSLIELSRFSPEYFSSFFCVFCVLHIHVNEQLHSHHHHLLDFYFPPPPPSSFRSSFFLHSSRLSCVKVLHKTDHQRFTKNNNNKKISYSGKSYICLDRFPVWLKKKKKTVHFHLLENCSYTIVGE